MSRLWWIPICAAALVIPAVVLAGSETGFDAVVSSIESRYHVHATRIPFLSVVSLVAHKATEGGVNGIHVAEIDQFPADVDGNELSGMVEAKLGDGWQRMIRETSKKGGEQTLIFAHPEGSRMGLFVLDLDGHEMDVVQVSVDPDHLNRSIHQYEHRRGPSHRDPGDSD